MPIIQRTSIRNMDSIQLKTKELQNKMYLTETHRLIEFIKEAIGSLCGGTWTTFRVEKSQFLQLRVLGRIL